MADLRRLDTLHRVETPEGVDLILRVAGPLPRFLAFVVDLLIRGVLWMIAGIALSVFGAAGTGIFLAVAFAIEELYFILFEVLYDGRTPGKQLLGLRAINFDGTPIDWTSSVIRNLLRIADMLPLPYVAGLLSMLFAGQFRRLGDLAAGTLVVYQRGVEVSADLPLVKPEPSPVSLQLEEQRALVSFAHRGPHLSRARAEELAAVAAPINASRTREAGEAVPYLYAIAAWLLGRRPDSQEDRAL